MRCPSFLFGSTLNIKHGTELQVARVTQLTARRKALTVRIRLFHQRGNLNDFKLQRGASLLDIDTLSQAPQPVGEAKKELSAKEKRMRALKIGAAAAGGGAILALTGDPVRI